MSMDPQLLTTLFSASYRGDIAAVKSIIKEQRVPVDTPDPSQGSTALHWACYGGNLELVEWLVKDAGAKVGQKNKDDRDALFFACEHCHKPVAAFLVGKGVDVNAADKSSGHAPLHRACIAGQTRDQAGAAELISFLLTSGKANPDVKDRNGRKPGEANLSVEAPTLKPSTRADEIRAMLEEARGVKPPSVAAVPKPAVVAARKAVAVTKPVAAPQRAPAAEPLPASEPVPAPTASRVAMRAAAMSKPAVVTAPTPVPTPAPVAAPAAPTGGIAARAAAFGASKGSPKAAAPTPAPTPAPAPAPVTATERPSATVKSRVAARAAALAASSGATVTGSAAAAAAPSSPSAAKTPPAIETTADSSSISSPADTTSSPRAGGVLPRSGGNLPVTANEAPVGSPAGATAAAAAAVSNSSPSTSPTNKTSTATATAAPAVADAPSAPVAVKPTVASTPLARYQRSAAGSVGGIGVSPAAPRAAATPPAKGAAHAVIAASNAPKASALAAAFESKARGRQSQPPPRRGDPGLSGSALAARAPALSSSSSTSSSGSSRNGKAVTLTSARNGSSKTSSNGRSGGDGGGGRAPSPTRVTAEELLGTGSILQKKKVYQAAAKKTSGTQNESPKSGSPTLLSKTKKKEASFMDKFVQMFSISPQSSRESSPARSRSPRKLSPGRTISRSPNRTNGTAQHTGDQPRLGFFNSNLSFKEKE